MTTPQEGASLPELTAEQKTWCREFWASDIDDYPALYRILQAGIAIGRATSPQEAVGPAVRWEYRILDDDVGDGGEHGPWTSILQWDYDDRVKAADATVELRALGVLGPAATVASPTWPTVGVKGCNACGGSGWINGAQCANCEIAAPLQAADAAATATFESTYEACADDPSMADRFQNFMHGWTAGRASLLAAIRDHNANCAAACGKSRGEHLCAAYERIRPGKRCPNCPMDDVIDVEGI